jgi:plastocyanin
MKSLLLFCIALFASVFSYATLYTITVSSNQFSPSTLNVVVGDQVQFIWSDGFHTSTCDPNSLPGTSHPAAAADWDQSMTNSSSAFTVDITAAGDYIYGCQPHWPGMAGSITASNPTPVKLISFIVTTVNNQPRLNWKTASEENSDYFAIRRSTDGANFKEVGRVKAAGSSSTEVSYSYTDNVVNKKDKYIYYSLGTTDKDGKIEHSVIKMFKNPNAVPKLVYSISPNPISKPGHLMLKFNADKQSTLYASLVNSEGKVVLKTEMSAYPGLNNGHFHLGSMAAGTYTVVFKLEGIKESYKIMVK